MNRLEIERNLRLWDRDEGNHTNIKAFKVFADFEHELFGSFFALGKIVTWCVRLGKSQ